MGQGSLFDKNGNQDRNPKEAARDGVTGSEIARAWLKLKQRIDDTRTEKSVSIEISMDEATELLDMLDRMHRSNGNDWWRQAYLALLDEKTGS